MCRTDISAETCNGIVSATYEAADEWNHVPYNSQGGNVSFCQRRQDATRDVQRATTCPASNSTDDGYTVTIQLIDGDTDDQCGKPASLACYKPEEQNASNEPRKDATLYIKEPAYLLGRALDGQPMRVRWTNDRYEHNMKTWSDESRTEVVYTLYLPGVIMHEFGHAAGLGELRDLPEEDYGHYIMHLGTESVEKLHTSIPDADAQWLHKNQRRNLQRVVKSAKYKKGVAA